MPCEWERAAKQARDDMRAIETEFAEGRAPIGPYSRFADWTSPANTMRWIDRLEASESSCVAEQQQEPDADFFGIVSPDGFIPTEQGPIHVTDVPSFFRIQPESAQEPDALTLLNEAWMLVVDCIEGDNHDDYAHEVVRKIYDRIGEHAERLRGASESEPPREPSPELWDADALRGKQALDNIPTERTMSAPQTDDALRRALEQIREMAGSHTVAVNNAHPAGFGAIYDTADRALAGTTPAPSMEQAPTAQEPDAPRKATTMQVVDGVPRRCRVDLYTPAEKAIADAIRVVEEAGAHLLLTEAVNLLDQAQSKVADYVESDPRDE